MEMMMTQFQRRLPEIYVQNTSNNFTDDRSSTSSSNPSFNNMSFFMEDYHFSSINHPPAATVSFAAQSPIVGGDIKPLSSWRKRKGGDSHSTAVEKRNMAEMREMLFKISAMQPVDEVDPESVKPPKRRNVKISKDPQSVAARRRRERISERIRILQRLVPGGTQMDTASMLDEAIHYMKFLKKQIESMEKADVNRSAAVASRMDFPVSIASGSSVVVLPWEHQQNINYLR